MQKFKIKDRMSVSLLMLLTALFVCFNPGDAFADLLGCMQSEAQHGIFRTIACKVTTTLFDIRKIVYILGGFGLIAFTFAAIFNKISFKHLGNIAISLFLLSMMTPFIEYFTLGEGQPPLKYGHFLQPDFTEADYSATFGECQGNDCPASVTAAGGGTSIGGGAGGGLGGGAGGLGSGGLVPGADGKVMPILPSGPVGSIPGLSGGVDLKTISLSPVGTSGGSQVDTRTGWQKFKDTIKTVKDEAVKGYNTASTVISAAKTVYTAVDSSVKGIKNAGSISEAITAGVGAFDNYTTATGAITSAAGTIGTNYTDKEGKPSLGQKVEDFFKGSNKGANEGKEVTQDVGVINGTANAAKDIPQDIGNIFK